MHLLWQVGHGTSGTQAVAVTIEQLQAEVEALKAEVREIKAGAASVYAAELRAAGHKHWLHAMTDATACWCNTTRSLVIR